MRDDFAHEVLWVIELEGDAPFEIRYPPRRIHKPADHNVPYPNGNSKLSGSKPINKMGKGTIKSLERLKEACKLLEDQCNKNVSPERKAPAEEEVLDVANNLKGLFELIVEFSKILQRFKPPENEPPKDMGA